MITHGTYKNEKLLIIVYDVGLQGHFLLMAKVLNDY